MDITEKIDEAIEKKKFNQKKFFLAYNKAFTVMRDIVSDPKFGLDIEDARKLNNIAKEFYDSSEEIWKRNK